MRTLTGLDRGPPVQPNLLRDRQVFALVCPVDEEVCTRCFPFGTESGSPPCKLLKGSDVLSMSSCFCQEGMP